jgi:hypothetical protein
MNGTFPIKKRYFFLEAFEQPKFIKKAFRDGKA